MKLLMNRKLATRIGIITTAITVTGMLMLWFTVSSRVASMVEKDITNQMIDAVESRASIINDYVSSAEEYITAFALGKEDKNIQKILLLSKEYLRDYILVLLTHMY